MPRRGGSGTAGRGFGSDPGFFENLTNNIGNFLSSDAAPVVLGQAAEAIMGGSPEGRQSWQSGLGRVASGLGQSRIASKAAQRQATERQGFSDMLTKFLTGRGGFTEPDADGPTDITFKAGGQGVPDKVTVTGNALMGGATRTPEQLQQRGAGTAGTASPPKPAGTVRPTAPPLAPTPNSGLLPFNLAQAVTGSAGGSGDLFGLDPQQISNITAGDIAGGGLTNLSSRTLYNNLVRQAQEGYYGRLPQARTPAAGKLSFTDMKINQGTGTWQYFDRVGNRLVDTGIRATEDEISGRDAPNWKTEEYITRDGIRRSGIFKDGRLFKDLGVVPETTEESGRSFGVDKELAEIEARILKQNANPQDMANFNSRSSAPYFYAPQEEGPLGWGEDYKKVDLPPGVMAKDMYVTMEKNPDLTLEQILQILRGK